MSHPHEKAAAYLQEHNIIKLMDILGAKIAFHQPDDINAFILQELKNIKEIKDEGKKYALFDEKDIESVFLSFDLTRKGYISRTQYDQGNNNFYFIIKYKI